ncbi:MAG: hypothetical protein Q9163_001256 [Psora crenata]
MVQRLADKRRADYFTPATRSLYEYSKRKYVLDDEAAASGTVQKPQTPGLFLPLLLNKAEPKNKADELQTQFFRHMPPGKDIETWDVESSSRYLTSHSARDMGARTHWTDLEEFIEPNAEAEYGRVTREIGKDHEKNTNGQ